MTLWCLVKRSLGFFWRTNVGVLLAVVVSTAVLTGALVVGDSVRHSLMLMVNARLGGTQFALVGGERFFRAALADDLAAELNAGVAPVLRLRGLMADGDGERRVNRVEVLGVDRRFFDGGPGGNPFGEGGIEGLVLNEPLARALEARPGDEVLLRVDKPGSMSRDIPLTPDSDLSIAFRLRVKAVASESDFGRFGLQADQIVPLNAFVPLEWLQEGLGRDGVANTLLVGSRPESEVTLEQANAAVKKLWRLEDAGLELRDLGKQNAIELRSSRVFIDDVISYAALDSSGQAVGILVYFVNELRLGERATPYSTVAAIAPSRNTDNVVPVEMKDDEILVNRWLADDLEAEVGDSIELTYYIIGPTRKLQEAKSRFRVRAVLPMSAPAVDPNLMPDYPGLADVDNCRDWEPGITIDLDKIRKADEDYWDRYRGTPKAFVTLDAGRAMWGNMYGNLTAVRYPQPGKTRDAVAKSLLKAVDPASVGLFFQPVRERGVKAGGGSTDFGTLFLGLSMFIVMASLILTGLLFVFGIESRVEQVGLLTAVGFSPKLVRRVLLMEAGILAVLGSVLGALAGLLYTWGMIYGLATVWGGALGGSTIYFHARASTLFTGGLSAVAVSLIAIRVTLRRQVSRPARELLAGGLQWQFLARGRRPRLRVDLLLFFAATIGAGLLIAAVGTADSGRASSVFFGAGALLLVAGLALCRAVLRVAAGGSRRPVTSLAHLGLRNATRRSGRSLAVIGLLACGVFLVIAVGANRRDPLARADRRDSGTGGFALYGESAMGILHDLNSREGRQASGLDDEELLDVGIVHLRVRDGDDASCFNLNRAQAPRLLGVKPEQLQSRGAFRFTKVIKGASPAAGWLLLDRDEGPGVVPAVGDYPTIVWALGKSVGDEIQYVDQKGRRFSVRLVGMLSSSVLQGSLLISEEQFVRRFPAEEGYRGFLIDAPADRIEQVTQTLASSFRDFGLTLTAAGQRLAAFSTVEKTYLSIFQILGGMGLVLGSVGLGLVVLRNVLERRGELAMLQAVGFTRAALQRMVLYEHCGLLLSGLACGVGAALVAVAPSLSSPGARVPYFSLTLTIAAIGISGLLWIRVATSFSLRGRMFEALRHE